MVFLILLAIQGAPQLNELLIDSPNLEYPQI